MTSNSKLDKDALHHLADALGEDIVNTPSADLLAEVAEDHGDPRALAMEFDRVFARACHQNEVRQAQPIFRFAGLRLLDSMKSLGEYRWFKGGSAQMALAALLVLFIAAPIVWQTLPFGPGPGTSRTSPPPDGAGTGGVPRNIPSVAGKETMDAIVLGKQCWALAVAGQLQAALSDCNESLRLRSNDADALNSRGFTHLKLGQLDDAIRDYDVALRLDPKIASALYGRGSAKLRKGDRTGAISDINAAEAIQPSIRAEFARYGVP